MILYCLTFSVYPSSTTIRLTNFIKGTIFSGVSVISIVRSIGLEIDSDSIIDMHEHDKYVTQS